MSAGVIYSIVRASIRHIRPMSEVMRPASAAAVQGYGFNPRTGLRRAFTSSFHCRTALVDGKPVAMWGVAGTLLGDTANVWLVLSAAAQKMPRAVLREAKAELEQTMRYYGAVVTTVLPDDAASVRFAIHLGFRGATEDGENESIDDDIQRDILANPKYRIPLGDSYAIRLGYQPREVR